MAHGKLQKGKITEESEILTHTRVLEILSQMTKNGSVSAAVSLERAFRPAPPEEGDIDDELDRLLSEDET
jgi:hypothetical protein